MKVVAALASLVLLLGLAPAAAGAETSADLELLVLINESRSQVDLPPVTMLGDLVDDARRHTDAMIEAGDLYHSSTRELTGYTTDWSLLGENVGLGPTPAALHRAFMLSPTHAENVLGPFSSVGIGSRRTSDGTLYVTVLFMQPTEDTTEADAVLSPLDDLRQFTTAARRSIIPDRLVPSRSADTPGRCVSPSACAD